MKMKSTFLQLTTASGSASKLKTTLAFTATPYAQIDYNAPSVSATQDGSTITATATDAGVGMPSSPVWNHSGPLDSDPTCSDTSTIDYDQTGNSVSSATDGKYYCFQSY